MEKKKKATKLFIFFIILGIIGIIAGFFLKDLIDADNFQNEFGFWPRNVMFYLDAPIELMGKENKIVSEILERNRKVLENELEEITKADRKKYQDLRINYREMSERVISSEKLAKKFGYLLR